MMWTALCAGVLGNVILSRAAGGMRRACPDLASAALRTLGGSGMLALATAAASEGALAAAGAAAICGAALTIDLPSVLRRVSTRMPRRPTPVPAALERAGRASAPSGATPAL